MAYVVGAGQVSFQNVIRKVRNTLEPRKLTFMLSMIL